MPPDRSDPNVPLPPKFLPSPARKTGTGHDPLDALETISGDEGGIPVGRAGACEFVLCRGVTVARLANRFDGQRDLPDLHKFLHTAPQGSDGRSPTKPTWPMVLNLAQATANSSLIGALLAVQSRCGSRDGKLPLCAVSPLVFEMLTRVRLTEKFHFFNTEDAAVLALLDE